MEGHDNDPHMDDSCDMREGLFRARRLLLDINALGLPAGTEMLDPITPQYIADLVSWTGIGARTTESQTHREMASGLSMPVGFKNSTEGNLQVAVNAIESARRPHSFIGITQDGMTAIVRTPAIPTRTWCCAAGARRTTTRQVSRNAAASCARPAWSRG